MAKKTSSDRLLPQTRQLTLAGVVFIALGVVALASPALAGVAVVFTLGGALLIAGILQLIQGFRGESWSHRIPPLVLGAVITLSGIAVLSHQWLTLATVTVVLALLFTLEGLWKIVASFSYRPASGWVLMLVSGLVTLLLGYLIWKQWPESALWAVGILVGVDLVMTGSTMVFLASTIRRLAKLAAG